MARQVLRLAAMGFPVCLAAEGSKDKAMKIAELPIYDPVPRNYTFKFVPSEQTSLQKAIGGFRKFLTEYQESVKNFSEKVSHKWEVSKAHTADLIYYIQNDPNVLARAGVITVAGLGGMLAGYRGGRIKKLSYSTIAIIGASSLCYPKQATDVTYTAYNQVVTQSCKLWKTITAPAPESEPVVAPVPKVEKVPAAKNVVNIIKADSSTKKPVEKDFGQSSEEDKDLYTTRG
ncbi:MICOS complex subunit MIC27-like [Argonauta hians]